jgi:catechol 2,3-dioxygenase
LEDSMIPEQTPDTKHPRIHPESRIGRVYLESKDVEALAAFYKDRIGMVELGSRNGEILLGAGGTVLLEIGEVPEIRVQPRSAGLFHFALRLPDRPSLAGAVRRLMENGRAVEGFADHLVSEAVYLRDPEGNGVEIYRDRPRDLWFRQGRLHMDTLPLDVEDLLSADSSAAGAASLPPRTEVGHVHLRVSDLRSTERFYTQVLGFDLTMHLGSQAGFVSAGGYHHHVGFNVWGGPFLPRSGQTLGGLRFYTILLPDEPELERTADLLKHRNVKISREGETCGFHDPSGIQVVLEATSPRSPTNIN